MGLINTEVEIGICNNASYYESLGYEIPRVKKKGVMCVPRGTKITVRIEDLSHSARADVEVNCDCCGKIYKIKYSNYMRGNHEGKTYCHHCATKIFNSGENNYHWDSNKTDKERIINRHYFEYNEFIKKVMARDNYTCVITGKTSNETELEVHHLNSYDWYIEGRCDETNGITITKELHKEFHLRYGYGNNTKEQFEEWLGYTLPLLEKYDGALPIAKQLYSIEENKVYKSVDEFCHIHKAPRCSVYFCCNHSIHKYKYTNCNGEIKYQNERHNTVKGCHLLWYDEYIQMTKEDIEKYLQKYANKSCKKTICVTTGNIFNSAAEASRYYKIDSVGICSCCRGKLKSSGKLPNGTKLKWMYLSDFEKLSEEEQKQILSKGSGSD